MRFRQVKAILKSYVLCQFSCSRHCTLSVNFCHKNSHETRQRSRINCHGKIDSASSVACLQQTVPMVYCMLTFWHAFETFMVTKILHSGYWCCNKDSPEPTRWVGWIPRLLRVMFKFGLIKLVSTSSWLTDSD